MIVRAVVLLFFSSIFLSAQVSSPAPASLGVAGAARGIYGVAELGNCTGSDLTADWGQKVMNCQSLLPSSGGTIDAGPYNGAQVCNTNVVLQPRVTLRVYTGTQISGTCTISLNSEDSIEGVGATGMYVDGQSGITWTYTAKTGNLITIVPGAYDVKLANIQFDGNPAGESGDGLFASPGPSYSPSNIGITLDHVTFRQFAQDGVHLEDNVYMVDCFRCAATDNGRFGWFQSPVHSVIGPNQVDVFAGRFNRNAVAQVFGQGGTSAGGFEMWGGSISSELYPSGTNYCAQFEAGPDQQMNASFNEVHFESCGGTSGGGAFIDWDALNGGLTVQGDYFVMPNGPTDDILLNASFGGTAVIGPGNSLVTNPGGFKVDNRTTISTGNAQIYDALDTGSVGNPTASISFLGASHVSSHIAPGGWEETLRDASLHFQDDTAGGSDFYIRNSQGFLSLTDGNGNPLLASTAGAVMTPESLVVGQHLEMMDRSTDLAGTISFEDTASGSHMFAKQFNNNPVCVVSPVDNAIGIWSYNTTQAGLYIFSGHPITTTFKYICTGAPN